MSKLLVSANSLKHLYQLLDKDIDGVILSVDKLSVNSSFYIDVDTIKEIDFKEKSLFISLNKIMHNSDLDNLRMVMSKLKNMNVRILFYDMAVYNISLEYDMKDKLVIYQEHLNASINSNNFYNKQGINGSYITSDITKEELLDIKKNTNMEIFFTVYGYLPIFYSRRYLVSNYLDYINVDKGNDYQILSDMGDIYPISEEEFGTTIYTKEVVNLINYLDDLKEIDYLVLNSNNIDNLEFNKIVDKFINHDKMVDCYLGFFDRKTIYVVKNKGDDKSE